MRLCWAVAGLLALPVAAQVSFNRDIRQIMSDTCFRCHGPDQSSRMAGLRLDLREQATSKTKSGIVPIVPGKPDESAIIDRVFAKNPARLMPPKYAHKELTAKQKDTLRQWVAEGAKYESHWAYQPVTRPSLTDSTAHPVDAFIRARLQKEGLAPSQRADKRTLIRRVSLDLTGLPPTPAEIRDFLADSSPRAYEKLVDRLLASPHYPEKQAMHWLDAVRYADTCGFHGDNPFPAWPYRDYVLRAFRDNKPFDVFTREQLAGDLMPGDGVEQWVASAFNRLTRTSAEGGIQPKEYLAKYSADRVRTTSAVWMGSTMGCAECHDHKFDPFTAKDFYSMKAFFADIDETGLVPDRGQLAWGTQITLPTKTQRDKLIDLKNALCDRRSQMERAVQQIDPGDLLARYERGELSWKPQMPLSAESQNGATLKIYDEELVPSVYDYRGSLVTDRAPGRGLIVASGANPDNDVFTVKFRPGAGQWRSIAIEAVQDDSLPGLRLARGSDRFLLTDVDLEAGGQRVPLVLATASSDNLSVLNDTPPMAALDDDPKTGWGTTMHGSLNLVLALRFGQPLNTAAETELTLRLHFNSDFRQAVMGRFRLAMSEAEFSWPGRNASGMHEDDSPNNGLPQNVVRALKLPEDERELADKEAIREYMAFASPALQPLVIEAAKLDARIGILDASLPRVVVTHAKEPEVTRVLARGNWMDESGEIVEPAIPAFLGKVQHSGPRATRLDLANWLISEDNPLTARVFANRMWRQFFGTGLSKALDDLGSQGEAPTHLELVDWLAAEFMQPAYNSAGTHAWDVRHLVRVIVTSETYKQSSLAPPDLLEKDPDNRLLARQSRPRVDAEMVRDIALSASGLLSDEFGGPSVKPVQPEGYLAALNFPRREYSTSRGKDQYRRGLYTMWQRTYLHPSLLTFDAPTREECTVNRVSSNTPLQALVLLNDPIYIEAARALAQGMQQVSNTSIAKQIDWAMERVLGRLPEAEETRLLSKLYADNLAEFEKEPRSAMELLAVGETPREGRMDSLKLAASTTVARAIINLHETITRN